MGHIRLGKLAATKKWRSVASLLSGGASVDQIAGATAEAAENSLDYAKADLAVQPSFWLLTQISKACGHYDWRNSIRFDRTPSYGLV